MLKKPGVQLSDILPSSEEEWLLILRNDFSITTAEELYCASLKHQDALRKHLNLSNKRWVAVGTAIKAALPSDLRQQLETPPTRFYPKGAKLQSPPGSMLEDLKKFTSHG